MKNNCQILTFILLINFELFGQSTSKFILSDKGCKVFCQSCDEGETTTWDGTCLNGFASGNGSRIIFNSNSKIISNYSGKLVGGKRSGFGINTWTDGERYDGNWLNDVKNGVGKQFYPDGSVYNGNWSNGEYKGQGTLSLKDGSKYVGIYRLSEKIYFKGKYYNSKGIKTKEGSWDNNEMFIDGNVFHENGKLFSVFRNGQEELSDYGKKISPIYPKDIKIWKKPRHFYGRQVTNLEIDDKYKLINLNGEILASEYDDLNDLSNGLIRGKRNKKIGYIDEYGHMLIPFKYDFADDFRDGVAKVCYDDGNLKCGYIDKNDKIIVPFQYSYSWDGYSSFGLIPMCDGQKTIYYDINGRQKKIVPGISKVVSNGTRFITKINGSSNQLLDENLNILKSAISISGYGSDETFVCEVEDEKYIIIDKFGKSITKKSYNDIYSLYNETYKFKVGGKFGFLDKSGNEIILPIFESADNFYEELANVSKDGKTFGFINKSGSFIIPPIYDAADNFEDGLAAVKKGGKWGYINKLGELIIPLIYDDATHFRSGIAWVYDSNKGWGILKKP